MSDICTIKCLSQTACTNLILHCDGACFVDCDESNNVDCPSNQSSIYYPFISTTKPTTTTTTMTTSAGSATSTNPTVTATAVTSVTANKTATRTTAGEPPNETTAATTATTYMYTPTNSGMTTTNAGGHSTGVGTTERGSNAADNNGIELNQTSIIIISAIGGAVLLICISIILLFVYSIRKTNNDKKIQEMEMKTMAKIALDEKNYNRLQKSKSNKNIGHLSLQHLNSNSGTLHHNGIDIGGDTETSGYVDLFNDSKPKSTFTTTTVAAVDINVNGTGPSTSDTLDSKMILADVLSDLQSEADIMDDEGEELYVREGEAKLATNAYDTKTQSQGTTRTPRTYKGGTAVGGGSNSCGTGSESRSMITEDKVRTLVSDDNGLDYKQWSKWSQKDVLIWLKLLLLANDLDKKDIRIFLTEFSDKRVNGALLKDLKTSDKLLDEFILKFSSKNQAYSIWLPVKLAIEHLE